MPLELRLFSLSLDTTFVGAASTGAMGSGVGIGTVFGNLMIFGG